MNDKQIKIVIGGLLHDIGKIIYRYNDNRNHSTSGYEFLKELGIDNECILEQVRYHHSKELNNERLDDNSPAYITYWADNVASGADRRSDEEAILSGNRYDKYVPLQSIFNILNGNDERKAYELDEILDSGEINYPTDKEVKYHEGNYGKIVSNIKEGLKSIEISSRYVNSLLSLLEGNLTYIPSSSDKSQLTDISLYDHMKITAAVGSCVYQCLEEKEITNFKEALRDNQDDAYKANYFLMFSMDISGIQRFIYKVDSSEALKSLRSKSFYLEIMLEHLIDELLEDVGVSRANLIYSGGGHAYILLPNTDAVINKLNKFKAKTNEWFVDNYGIDLYVAMGYTACSANSLKNQPNGAYEDIFKNVSKELSQNKASRYSANEIISMNAHRAEEATRECKVCGRVDHLTEDDICEYCNSFKSISKDILSKELKFITIINNKDEYKKCLRLPFNRYMVMEDEDSLKDRIGRNDGGYIRSYSKNKMYTGVKVSTSLWVGDYSSESSFEKLANASMGIDRLGVLRADVDNLGKAFVKGFPPEYTSLSRTASFSRKLSMFFKLHINNILEHGEYALGNQNTKRNATIVYSGGDDIFLVGAWDDVIGLAVDISDSLRKYSQGTLTISAGIGIFPRKYPVKAIARQTGMLEDASKKVDGKNAITLFEDTCGEQTYTWDNFKSKVIGEKYAKLDKYISSDDEKGMSAIYNLLGYIRNLDDRINLARLAYMLGRMEPDKAATDEQKEEYREFSKSLYNWMIDDSDGENKRELITAIYIYVYLHRGKEGGNENGEIE